MEEIELARRFFPEIRAGGFSRIDSTVQFYERVNALVERNFVLLDFGAGRGGDHLEDCAPYRRELRNFRGKVREVIGADVDPIVTTNPSLDRAIVLAEGGTIPLPDRSIHLVISDFTFEHIYNPDQVANELDRILAPGGWICARTPNRYGYIAFANRLLPEFLRMHIVRWSQPRRKEEDVFKTFYRLNTYRALRRYFNPARFDHIVYSWDAEPAYHANSKLLYQLSLAIHAVTPPPLKTLLLIFLQKKRT